ncbi:aspartate--tRNA(Asn) ligase [Candidatus Micrarchaeota archaeon]|nr:aspartate--tRNA(Asn) ligase [Candidatus Micrarchaeota archaeon]
MKFRTHYVSEAKKSVGKKVKVAGWVHDIRDLGKLKFIILRDKTGILQILLKKGLVPDAVLDNSKVNKEDVVLFEGEIKENKIAPDGVELVPTNFELLNKVEQKLPVDPTDAVPAELDTRLDYRYVDLRRKIPTAIFNIKSICANSFRNTLAGLGFTEIHPTAITGAATEGGTDVFTVQYFENQAYLVQSPQLYKQLAVIGGFDKVMMAVPVFRAEKHNTTSHLNEIIQMDIEMGFADHLDVMKILEQVFLSVLKEVNEKCSDDLKNLKVELKVPKKLNSYTYTELVERLNKAGFYMKWGTDFTKEAEKKISELLDEEAYFIYDWPTAIRAFYSMPSEKDEKICHAFDLVYRGLEISSGAQRIHKVSILEDQLKKRGLDPYAFEFYLNAFRLGAPPHAGWSIGLERLVQKITLQDNIRECMMFPRDRVRLHP